MGRDDPPNPYQLKLSLYECIYLCFCRWKKVEDKLFGADDIPVAVLQAGKLRDKDRQIIKDKFSVSLWIKRVL